MMRSMYSGVAGLKTHQTRMDVIGNNIANVNTVGYKSQSALFAELLYQNSSAASGPNTETKRGGINPKQVGLGTKMASISTNITLPGSMETTNNPFDVCITGDSFFVVSDGRNNFFTRDGSFKVDAAGNLVLSSNGYQVMGWQVDSSTNDIKKDTVSALQIMSAANMTYPPEATTEAYVSGIIDRNSPEVNSDDGKLMNLKVFDSLGYEYTAKLSIKATGTNGQYTCELVALLDPNGKEVVNEDGTIPASLGARTEVTYDPPKEHSFNSNYEIVRDNAGQFTIKSKDPDNKESFVIGNTGITATDSDGNPITDETQMWDALAAVFSVSGGDKFQNMVMESYNGTAAGGDVALIGGGTPITAANLSAILEGNYQKKLDENAGYDGTDAAYATLNQIAEWRDSAVMIEFSTEDGSFKGVRGTDTGCATLTINGDSFPATGINVDFTTLSNVSNEKVSTAAATNGSLKNLGGGRKLGKMSGLAIQNDGKIYASYDNGQSRLLGQIAVGLFANPSGLQKEGDNLYSATQNSGDFDGIGVDITSDGGYMTSGELEMSNVDLSGELTGMIVTQRGFQANSRIITVSDTMLEELINLKR